MSHAINQQCRNIFVKFRRYLVVADLDDLHVVLKHQTFHQIKTDLTSPSQKAGLSFLIQSLFRYSEDPLIASVLSAVVKPGDLPAKDPKVQLHLLRSGQFTPTREQMESYLEFFLKTCAVSSAREAESIENFEIALSQLALLLTNPTFARRLDPYDDTLYGYAIQFADGRSSLKIRTAIHSFFTALCHTYGIPLRDIVITLLRRQLAIGRDSIDEKRDLIHVLLGLVIDFGGDSVAEGLAEHADYLRRRFSHFDAIAVVADLLPQGSIPQWLPGFWVGWAGRHISGSGPRDVEFCDLALTCASFEQAAAFLERRFKVQMPSGPQEWKIAAAVFGRFPDRTRELVEHFTFYGRPSSVTPDIAPFVDAIFGPGPTIPDC
jgi:hypothetical protein